MQVLHRLYELALDVARVRSFDGRINQALAAAHGVEEELRGAHAGDEGVLHEAARLHAVVKAREVGQRAVLERVLDAATRNQLLAQQRGHLRDVQLGALGARVHHLPHAVVRRQTLHQLTRDRAAHFF